MRRFILALVLFLLFASSANAKVWFIQPTAQDGTPGGFDATLGMLSWVSDGVSGASPQHVYGASGDQVGYACYGLGPFPTNSSGCALATPNPIPIIWDAAGVVYTGGRIDDGDLTSPGNSFSWTGQAGTEARTANPLFASSILSGTYFGDGTATGTDGGAGYDDDGFSCWNDVVSAYTLADFCGNGTGTNPPAPGTTPQDISNRFLRDGILSVVDEGHQGRGVHQILVTMTQSNSGPSSADITAKWRFNATSIIPVPAAAWLFGSGLAFLGFLTRKGRRKTRLA